MTRPDATRQLCEWVIRQAREPLPDEVRRAAERSLLNVVGTTIGAAHSDAIEAVVRYATRIGAEGDAPVLGRVERLAPTTAAVAAGVAAHYDDFDDTHLETVIHPAAAGLGAVLALAPSCGASGEQVLTAFALGIEAQLRIGSAISPSHYDTGWHITGTCGVLGSAVTSALLLGFDAESLEHALGLAACMTVGVREAFGTMTKPYHPGRASANGVLAARLVAAGTDGPTEILERPRGFVDVLAEEVDWARITEGLGTHWELLDNTFKPYPCGIVTHPAIAAASALHPRVPADRTIQDVEVRCHALVPELTGNPDPQDGLQARFSTIHGVCAGLADGPVSLPQYDDARVREPDLVALRARTTLEVDPSVARDAAIVSVTLDDGARLTESIEHAPGSLARPLTDEELLEKVRSLVEPILPGRTDAVRRAVETLADADDLAGLIRAGTPDRAPAGGSS